MSWNNHPAAAPAATLTTTYETRYGTGLLVWQNRLLVRHLLPGVATADSDGNMGGISPAQNHASNTEPADTADDRREVIRQALEAYLAGRRVEFPADCLPLDWSAWTNFGQKVALALASVPYGEVVSYAELAAAAGHPRACRAVGNFMAANPFPLLLPCHRVIRSDGGPGGFSGGRHWKQRLLAIEGVELKGGRPSAEEAHPIDSSKGTAAPKVPKP